MGISATRKENVSFLIDLNDTQTRLAELLEDESLTQPILSSIVHGKRQLYEKEARRIEEKLGIPHMWIDKYPLSKAWRVIIKFRAMSKENKEIANELLKFAEEQK